MKIVKSNGGLMNTAKSPWNDFLNLDVFNWGSDFSNPGNSLPAVNIKETPDSFEVEMAAPGMDKNDFKIELDDNTLIISSEKEDRSEKKEGENYSRKEFSYQSFYRTFHLSKDVVEVEKIIAKYENGLLRLMIPKKEEVKKKPVRTIEIS